MGVGQWQRRGSRSCPRQTQGRRSWAPAEGAVLLAGVRRLSQMGGVRSTGIPIGRSPLAASGVWRPDTALRVESRHRGQSKRLPTAFGACRAASLSLSMCFGGPLRSAGGSEALPRMAMPIRSALSNVRAGGTPDCALGSGQREGDAALRRGGGAWGSGLVRFASARQSDRHAIASAWRLSRRQAW